MDLKGKKGVYLFPIKVSSLAQEDEEDAGALFFFFFLVGCGDCGVSGRRANTPPVLTSLNCLLPSSPPPPLSSLLLFSPPPPVWYHINFD